MVLRSLRCCICSIEGVGGLEFGRKAATAYRSLGSRHPRSRHIFPLPAVFLLPANTTSHYDIFFSSIFLDSALARATSSPLHFPPSTVTDSTPLPPQLLYSQTATKLTRNRPHIPLSLSLSLQWYVHNLVSLFGLLLRTWRPSAMGHHRHWPRRPFVGVCFEWVVVVVLLRSYVCPPRCKISISKVLRW